MQLEFCLPKYKGFFILLGMGIAAVEKAFSLLEFLAVENRPVTLAEAANACDLPKPTAFRLLATLQQMGYVGRPSGAREYFIGPRSERLGAADPHLALKAAARPMLEKIHQEFDETVNLGILSGANVVYVDFVETTRPLRMIVAPGQSDPYFRTALGRAIASRLCKEKFDRLLAVTRFEKKTGKTVVSERVLRSKILEAKTCGYAEEVSESVDGVACVAAALDSAVFPASAISISVPVQRYGASRRKALIHSLLTCTKS